MMQRFGVFALVFMAFLGSSFLLHAEEQSIPYVKSHALSLYGDLKYGPDFTHFDYVNPNAPKGGTLKLSAIGTFDSTNPFILKGVPAAGSTMIYQTLLESSADEEFSEYASLAREVHLAKDRSFVEFIMREEAKWDDGEPLTAHDVVWSFHILKEKGNPFYGAYYAAVKSVEAKSDYVVRFTFSDETNRELPLIVGQLPILPKHYWDGKDFSKTTLEKPLGSGPYRIKSLEAGAHITYERVKDWWAADLPINVGRYNFDEIRYSYFRDASVALQAFLSGDIDARQENTAKSWATSYVGEAVKDGRIVLEEIDNSLPTGMQAFIFNIRRPIFQDRAVRDAINYAFDFEWSNKQFAYGAYARTISYFSNSELASYGTPQGRELEILEQFRGQVPDEVFEQEYIPPSTDGSGNNRTQLRTAMKILDDAGWALGDDKIRQKDGVRLSFEVIVNNPAFERWFSPFVQNLKRVGIEATLRVLDTAQYTARMDNFDYDMTVHVFGQSNSPGNEQKDYWHSSKVDQVGSRNKIGISDPVIDELVEMVIAAPDRDELVARTRALDRVLLSGRYVVPNWYISVWRVAYWDTRLDMPEVIAPYSLGISDRWWSKQETVE